MNDNRIFNAMIYILISLVIGITIGYFGASRGTPGENSNINLPERDLEETEFKDELKMFTEAYTILRKHHFFDTDSSILIEAAIEGMLYSTDDPHTAYFNQEEFREFIKNLETSFGGIGVFITIEDGRFIIDEVLKDQPADKAGIKPADIITHVDGVEVYGNDVSTLADKIIGEKDTNVVLTINRGGEELEITVKRAIIPNITVLEEIKAIDYQNVNYNVGYVQVTSFGENTDSEFSSAINRLEDQGIDGLVIDLRGNGGGYLDTVKNMASEFILKNEVIMYTEDLNGNKTPHYAKTTSSKKEYDIVVLVDETSASASEVFAAALKEAGGYDIVGETTYGKGTMQIPIQLSGERLLKITTERWLTPQGNWINNVGVKPTIEVQSSEFLELRKIIVDQDLELDDVSIQVENMQKALELLGYDLNRTDGYFDNSTKDALKGFEEDHMADYGIVIDGILDADTAYVINSEIIDEIKNEENDLQLIRALQEAIIVN